MSDIPKNVAVIIRSGRNTTREYRVEDTEQFRTIARARGVTPLPILGEDV